MFASVIQYRLNPIFERDFLRYWKQHARLLRENNRVTESVLHRETKISYIAYQRWSSREAFEAHSRQPQGELLSWHQKIQECCNDVRVIYRMVILKEAQV